MTRERIVINRTLVGVIALACLGIAGGMWLAGPAGQQAELWRAGFVRIGVLMSALWLALPTRTRTAAWANVSPWTFVGMLVLLIATIRLQLKVVLPLAVALIVIGLVLRPRDRRRV